MSKESNDPLTQRLRAPDLKDKLFEEGEDWRVNAWLSSYHDPTELYILGYKEAADLLVENIAIRNGNADSLVFPIVFLYRHYLELRLKSLLHDGCNLLDKKYRQKPEHQLSKIWPRVRAILDELWPNEESKDLQAIDSLIEQFEEVDPKSTSFRYPKDFDGNNSLKLNTSRVNLRNLADVVRSMSIILEGSAGAISEYQSHKSSMQGDYY